MSLYRRDREQIATGEGHEAAIRGWAERGRRFQLRLGGWWAGEEGAEVRALGPALAVVGLSVMLFHFIRTNSVALWMLGPTFLALGFVAVFLLGFETGRGGWRSLWRALESLERKDAEDEE